MAVGLVYSPPPNLSLQVTPEGRYVKPPRKEMAYGALIG